MADVESKDFRTQARQNGYGYGVDDDGSDTIFIYKAEKVTLREYGLPTYALRSAVGAIESLVGMIQNTNQGTDGDAKQKRGKNIPGATTDENPRFSVQLSLQGPMYFLSYDDYVHKLGAIDRLVRKFGWEIIGEGISRLYRPSMRASATGTGLYSEDPIAAGNRAMLQSSFGHIKNAQAVLWGIGDDANYAKNIVQLERSGFEQTFRSFADAFSANTGSGMVGAWRNAGYPIRACVAGFPIEYSINVVPTSLKITPGAYVVDSTSGGRAYPTQIDVSAEFVNIYGSLIAAGTDLEE